MFFNLSAAWDTIDKNTVVDKLYALGVREKPLQLIIFFLIERPLYIASNEISSHMYNVGLRVAQYSILGPLIFISFMNHLRYSMVHSYVIHFADNTTIVLSMTTDSELHTQLQDCMNQFEKWREANKLLVNGDKTVFICFYLRPTLTSNIENLKPM